jgi:hypothetical protein
MMVQAIASALQYQRGIKAFLSGVSGGENPPQSQPENQPPVCCTGLSFNKSPSHVRHNSIQQSSDFFDYQ